CRLAINFPAMFIDDLQRVGEPKSGAIALGREKRHKQIASFLLGHAVAVVADADYDLRAITLRADGQVSSIGHRIKRVPDQIQNCLPELLGIGVNRRQIRIDGLLQFHVLRIQQWLHEIEFFLQQPLQPNSSALRLWHSRELEVLLQHLANSQYLRTHFAQKRLALLLQARIGIYQAVKLLPDQI